MGVQQCVRALTLSDLADNPQAYGDEIRKLSPGEDLYIDKLGERFHEQHGRPMRLAIDAEISVFRHQWGTKSAHESSK